MDSGLLTVSVSPRELIGTYGVPRAAAYNGSALFAASTLRRPYTTSSIGGPASSSPCRARTPASAPGSAPGKARRPRALSLAELRGIVLTRPGTSQSLSASASQRSWDRTLNPYWPAYAADFSSPWDPVDDADGPRLGQSTQSRLGWCVSQPGDGDSWGSTALAVALASPAAARRPASEPAPQRPPEPGGRPSAGARRAQRGRTADGPPPGVAEDTRGAPERREEDEGGAAPERGQHRPTLPAPGGRAVGGGGPSPRRIPVRHSTSSAPSYGAHRGKAKKYNPFEGVQDPTHNVELRKRWLADDKAYLEARTEDLRRERRLNERFGASAASTLEGDGDGLPKVRGARALGQPRRRRPRREVAGPAGKASRRPEAQPCVKSLKGLQRQLGKSTQDVENASKDKGPSMFGFTGGASCSIGFSGPVRRMSMMSGGSARE